MEGEPCELGYLKWDLGAVKVEKNKQPLHSPLTMEEQR